MKLLFFALLALPLSVGASDQFVSIYSPPGTVLTDGNAYSLMPFSLFAAGAQSARYQQVFSSADFVSRLPSGGFLTDMYLRIDQPSGHGFSSSLEMQIDLSTTQSGIGQLNSVFGNNIGPDDTTVIGRGLRQLTASYSPFASVEPFNFHFNFEKPMYYDPQGGNLLLDVRTFNPDYVFPDPFQFHKVPPLDGVDNAGAVSITALSVDSLSGNLSSVGLVALFVARPIPEPGTGMLLLLSAGLFVPWLWHKRRQSLKIKEG